MLRSSASADILLVDDDPDARLLLRDALGAASVRWRVHEAAGGREALDFLRRRGRFAEAPRPAAVVLDVEMPDVSGREVLKMIRSDPRLADIPTVIVSSAAEERQDDLLREGADAVLSKSPETGALRRALERLVRLPSDSEPGSRNE